MRFGVFIIALLACEVAHAQTPLPRARPHAASDNAARSDIIKAAVAVPIPRMRPSEAPAARQAAPAPEKSEPRVVTVPMPRERPAAAMKRIVEAVLAATKDEPKAEAKPSETKSSEAKAREQKSEAAVVASIPMPSTRPAQASPRPVQPAPQVAKPEPAPAETVTKPVPPVASAPSTPKEEAAPAAPKAEAVPVAPKEEPAPQVATAPVEAPRVVPQENAEGNTSSSAAIISVPMGTVRAAPDAGPPGGRQDNHDNAPMEEPVPPLASPPAPASEQQVARLEPKPAAPAPAAAAPTATVELPKLDPPHGEHTMQVAQLPPTLIEILKKLPIPKKRPLSAWPRPDDLVFRDVTGSTPEAECDAALNSGILIAERLPSLGRRGGCYVPYAVKVDAIMVGRKRIEIMPPAKLRCGFALAIANWVRADFAPAAASLGANFVGLRQLDSYNCRTMSSTRRLMSEHSMGNALDIAEVVLAGHHRAHLTDRNTQKAFRARLRSTACNRFKTVLGPGVPQHHDHIHVDLRKHYGPGGICHWNVL